MAKDWPFLNVPAGPAASILHSLHASWPEPINLTPEHAGLAGEDRGFLLALIALQDAGWVMCEAILAGAVREPCALDAVLTAKGRDELARRRDAAP